VRVDIAPKGMYSEQVALERATAKWFVMVLCLFFENSTVCRYVSAMFVVLFLCCASDQCGACRAWCGLSVVGVVFC